MIDVDFSRFNFPRIASVIHSLQSFQGPQYNFITSLILELAIEKYSDGQLIYIGDQDNGRDFVSTVSQVSLTPVYYECKSMKDMAPGLFRDSQTRKNSKLYTKDIILKNYHPGGNANNFVQTFDYMILVDTQYNAFGICDWESCVKSEKFILGGSGCKTKILKTNITVIQKNIIPDSEFVIEDFRPKIESLIREHI